jgi:hypothetical protein
MCLWKDATIYGMPYSTEEYYYRLQGRWRNGDPVTFGNWGTTPTNPPTNYMFSWGTDPSFPGQTWTEEIAGSIPSDRRFMVSAGAFTLQPGEVKNITMGVMWARAQQGGRLASVEALKTADDKAQALFDNCFTTIDGPKAPDLAIRELDKKVIITLKNYFNEDTELYSVKDPMIVGVDDSMKFFKFQGYQIYQLKNATVTQDELLNSDKARLVAQCDIKDGIGQLVNLTYDSQLNSNIPVEMVNGSDKGIEHTFEITSDMFATGSTRLVNHKSYYYTIVAYAHNEYKKYDPLDPLSLDGQKQPYLSGEGNVKIYSAIPHHHAPENNGQTLNSSWGDGIILTRLEGKGNGGFVVDLMPESVEEIITPPHYRSFKTKYRTKKGPVDIRVYDPVKIISGDYQIKLEQLSSSSYYFAENITSGLNIKSDYPISYPNQQTLPEWGLTTMMKTTLEPGNPDDPANGFLEATMEFSDPSKPWLKGVADNDQDQTSDENWIRSGTDVSSDYIGFDNGEIYENVIGGQWAPYKLTAKTPAGPKWSGIAEAQISLSPNSITNTGIQSVDIIITSDQSKWSRVAVVETGSDINTTIGNAKQYDLRKSISIGKNGQPDPSVNNEGMSWFPGYAYDVETGERLNIAFGENSSLTGYNSQDMKFNPTPDKYDNGTTVFGGIHYLYIFGHNGDGPNDVPMYDSCRFIVQKLSSGITNDKRAVWKDAMWCSLPLLSENYRNTVLPLTIPSEVKIRIRVARNYKPYAAASVVKNTAALIPGQIYYVASTPVIHDGISYNTPGQSFTANNVSFSGNGTITTTPPANNFLPLYQFSTANIAPVKNNSEVAKDALTKINVVPNPYYAWSSYSTNSDDQRIRLINLPSRCTITILTQSGTMIKKIERSESDDNSEGSIENGNLINSSTSVDWDLKNHSGTLVSSGVYLIHIDAGSLGTRTLKWFGLMRPSDSAGF